MQRQWMTKKKKDTDPKIFIQEKYFVVTKFVVTNIK